MPNEKKDVETELIEEAVKKWTDLPSRTLARKLIKDNTRVFAGSSLEQVRNKIRYLRGTIGESHRKRPGGGTAKQTSPHVPHDPEKYYVPESQEDSFLPYVVVTGLARDAKIDVLGDLHFPYHSVSAIKAALKEMDRDQPDIILLNGDILDFYKLSRFMKDPRARSAKEEIETVSDFLDTLQCRYPKTKFIWKDGNHDERLDHYIMVAAPEIYDMAKGSLSIRTLLKLDERGFDYVTDKRPIYAGHLTILHGHEYPTPVLGPVNAARGLFLRTKACALVHHHHQVSEHGEPTVRDKMISTWSAGCLCGLHPAYARFNKWMNGYARVTLRSDGDFNVVNHKISEGRLLN